MFTFRDDKGGEFSSQASKRLARLKFELDQSNQISEGGKYLTILTSSLSTGKTLQSTNFFSKGLIIPKLCQMVKSERYETFWVSKFLVWRHKMGRPRPASHLWFVEFLQVQKWLCDIVQRNVFPRQINLRILELRIRKGHRNLSMLVCFCQLRRRRLWCPFTRTVRFWLPFALRAQPPYAS